MQIQPLKPNFSVDEDKGFVPDQIKERVNSEAWYEYCKKPANPPIPLKERNDYLIKIGRDYLRSSKRYLL